MGAGRPLAQMTNVVWGLRHERRREGTPAVSCGGGHSGSSRTVVCRRAGAVILEGAGTPGAGRRPHRILARPRTGAARAARRHRAGGRCGSYIQSYRRARRSASAPRKHRTGEPDGHPEPRLRRANARARNVPADSSRARVGSPTTAIPLRTAGVAPAWFQAAARAQPTLRRVEPAIRTVKAPTSAALLAQIIQRSLERRGRYSYLRRALIFAQIHADPALETGVARVRRGNGLTVPLWFGCTSEAQHFHLAHNLYASY